MNKKGIGLNIIPAFLIFIFSLMVFFGIARGGESLSQGGTINGSLNITGNLTIQGFIFGASPLKIGGDINLSVYDLYVEHLIGDGSQLYNVNATTIENITINNITGYSYNKTYHDYVYSNDPQYNTSYDAVFQDVLANRTDFLTDTCYNNSYMINNYNLTYHNSAFASSTDTCTGTDKVTGVEVTEGTVTVTCDSDEAGGVPQGAILMFVNASCPSGYTQLQIYDTFLMTASNGNDGGDVTAGVSTLPNHAHPVDVGETTALTGTNGSHTHTYTDVPNHVHVQNLPSGQTGGQASGTRDTSTTGSTADALSTANPTGGVATGTTVANGVHNHTVSINPASVDSGNPTTNPSILPTRLTVVLCKKD